MFSILEFILWPLTFVARTYAFILFEVINYLPDRWGNKLLAILSPPPSNRSRAQSLLRAAIYAAASIALWIIASILVIICLFAGWLSPAWCIAILTLTALILAAATLRALGGSFDGPHRGPTRSNPERINSSYSQTAAESQTRPPSPTSSPTASHQSASPSPATPHPESTPAPSTSNP